MKALAIALPILLLSISIFAQDQKKVLDKVMYVNQLFAQVHKNPSKHSIYLTTTECGHPVKVYKLVSKSNARVLFNRTWKIVKVGSYDGYMNGDYLSSTKPKCFQDKYPKFFDSLDLEITDMFYWGKLYDQYVTGQSRAN
ncbi:hypothetical protein BIY24_12915 [Halobacteriovorax marinus]|uniref:hypothetical protein n=1 Tax=Halobacteriovorax marinus TaxID=97084 RepID=UPI000BC357CE|nr:hypothetical protein [Halobacteriovorax marinus]ATH08814.1 hypothetical protein BIY24_12915 [Halobacteriovorax marinus]